MLSSLLNTHTSFIFYLITPDPPTSTLFPYTTLFRSRLRAVRGGEHHRQYRLEHDPARSHPRQALQDRKSTRLNSSHRCISYAVFCLKKKKKNNKNNILNTNK